LLVIEISIPQIYKKTNSKHQIPNKSQIPILNDQNLPSQNQIAPNRAILKEPIKGRELHIRSRNMITARIKNIV